MTSMAKRLKQSVLGSTPRCPIRDFRFVVPQKTLLNIRVVVQFGYTISCMIHLQSAVVLESRSYTKDLFTARAIEKYG